jgi:hypothetical protein
MAGQMEVMRVPAKLTLPEGVRIIRAPVRTWAGLGRVAATGRAKQDGAWRSLVAHLLWEQRVGGSNPSAPTIRIADSKRP